jgi:heme-degrading monooxygenase HmoA
MAVTEIAILHAKAGEVDGSLRKKLQAAQSIQDTWHASNFPNSPSSAADRGAAMFQQVEDPANILITAQWDSVAAHWQWIRSDENKSTMEDLSDQITSEGMDGVVLIHLNAELFSQPAPARAVHLLDSPVISIGRLRVNDKEALAAKWCEVEGILKDFLTPHLVRTGWREDKGANDKDEFVLVCGWESVAQHAEFRESPGWAKYSEITKLVAEADIRHYRRFQ